MGEVFHVISVVWTDTSLRCLIDTPIRLMRGTSNPRGNIYVHIYDNCNGVPRTFRSFLNILLFAVYPSILEWADTSICFIEPDHAFKI